MAAHNGSIDRQAQPGTDSKNGTPKGFGVSATYPQCSHLDAELRARTIKGGAVQYAEQCLRCGQPCGSPVAKSAVRNAPPPFDKALYEKGLRAESEFYARQRDQESAQWWAWYQSYLKSPEWHAKRKAVILRAQGLCEGCRQTPATQVHHLTYKRAGREMLFDLVAVCDECHEICHEDKERG
jgi:5-methylcytosine-specific restriction endonuclease McrA